MKKIKELFKNFIETQIQINESLKGLREDLKPKLDKITINGNTITSCQLTVDRLDNYIESNIYSKEQTVETINKEFDYRKEYERCLETNAVLLEMIEKYCKYDDKYEVLKLFELIDEQYEVKRKTAKKVGDKE